MKVELKGKAEVDCFNNDITIEFGRTQAEMSFSENGSVARKLKLKDGDRVRVTIEKVRK